MLSNDILRKVQLKELEILLEIKRICDNNNINYYLCFGTLLGAVRHKGFIPWDDDVDIYMKRDDYNRFLQVAPNQISKNFFIESSKFNSNFPRTFTKVKANGTIFLEKYFQSTSVHPGIWVDVFPLDSLSKSSQKSLKFKIHNMLLLQSLADYSANILDIKKIHSKIFFKLFSLIFGKSALSKKEKLMISNNHKTSNYLVDFNNIKENKVIFKKDFFESSTLLEFEGHYFSVPATYNEVLTQVYGDYMTPPPIEEQVNKHEIIKVKV